MPTTGVWQTKLSMAVWHIITGEYPPQVGGVGDYSQLVAKALAAAGNVVHVWTPGYGPHEHSSNAAHQAEPRATGPAPLRGAPGEQLHRLPGHFGPAALAKLALRIRQTPRAEILVQYVPHAYGLRGMNLPFCLWLKAIGSSNLTVMFHEVMFPQNPHQPVKHRLLAAVTRLMARLASRSATRIIIPSGGWEPILRRLGAAAPIVWAPVPSSVPLIDDPATVAQLRRESGSDRGLLLGHFANQSNYSAQRLSQILPGLMAANSEFAFLAIGRGSRKLVDGLAAPRPDLGPRLHATGVLDSRRLSSAIAACDLMVQFYPDGVSARRSSAIAPLAHGRAIVSNPGPASEPLWHQSRALALAPDDQTATRVLCRLMGDLALRRAYEQAAASLYDSHFALRHTIAALTGGG